MAGAKALPPRLARAANNFSCAMRRFTASNGRPAVTAALPMRAVECLFVSKRNKVAGRQKRDYTRFGARHRQRRPMTRASLRQPGMKYKRTIMKRSKSLVLLILLFASIASSTASANGGRGHRGHSGHHHSGHSSFGLSIGIPLGLPYYYPSPYYYSPRYYYPPQYYYPSAPLVVGSAAAPPVYIEQDRPQASGPLDPNYWYYCSNPQGYYPYVKDCRESWTPVPPSPR
ncbi:MAG: proline-rich region [Herminiimonas sp.]|nr:proline-rich region [Herminiimonas sp.]